jgi:fucose 4-O-acetylase-like acetyltransferase
MLKSIATLPQERVLSEMGESEHKLRVTEYDVMRVILIIFVVIGHANYRTREFGNGGVDWAIVDGRAASIYYSWFFAILRAFGGWVYGFHMPVFFALSGAVSFLHQSDYQSLDMLAWKKAKRLIIPYYLTGLLFMLPIKYISGGYTIPNLPSAIVSFSAMVSDAGHLWFLTALFWCFIFFYFIYTIGYFKKNSIVYILLFSVVVGIIASLDSTSILGISQGLSNLIWFSLGFCFGHIRSAYTRWIGSNKVIYRCGMSLMALMLALNATKYGILAKAFTVIFAGLVLYAVSRFLCNKTKLTNTRLFKVLLRYSMFIYLFHDPLNYVVLKISSMNSWIITDWGCTGEVILRTVGVIVISTLLGVGVVWAKRKVVIIYNNWLILR